MIASMTYFSPSENSRKYATIFFVFLLCFGLAACNKTSTFTPPTLAVLSMRETYDQAKSIAKAWQSDAQLHSANFDIRINASPDNVRGSYVFVSASNPKFLIVDITKSGHETVEFTWPVDRPIGTAISFEEIHLESQQALNSIMKNGGNSFFERYRVRENRSSDVFFLKLERLDEYKDEGPIIWTAGFAIDNPQAQLYMSLDDATGDLLKVKAYGEEEQEYWFRDIAVTEMIPIGGSKNFFDLFDLRLDKIGEENGRRYADFTIISPQTSWLIRGEMTRTHIEQDAVFPFDNYEITLIKINQEWIEVQVMPIVRWYKPKPGE